MEYHVLLGSYRAEEEGEVAWILKLELNLCACYLAVVARVYRGRITRSYPKCGSYRLPEEVLLGCHVVDLKRQGILTKV